MKNGYNKLILPTDQHYNWIDLHGELYKFYESTSNFDTSFFFLNHNILNKEIKLKKIINIINLKNKTGLIKTDFNFKKTVLNKIISNTRANTYFNSNYEVLNTFAKSYDLKKNLRKYLNNNKKYLSIIFKRKFHNNITYSKRVKSFSKSTSYFRLYKTEMNVKNILMRSGFFINSNDLSIYFLEGCIYLNGINCNKNTIVKKNDIINIEFDEDFYKYYRYDYSNSGGVSNLIKNAIRKNNSNRFNSVNINSKLKNYINFNDDVPTYLEVDYLTMSCVVVKNPSKFQDFNSINLNFINSYLGRIYNWKFIT